MATAIALGSSDIRFRGYVYGSDEVRARLNDFHRGKCAFCETRVLPVSSPHVEHFRPKAGYVCNDSNRLIVPGYYWLAYCWNNLFLACPRCNSNTFKGNLFPIRSERLRAIKPVDDISLEGAILIDPVSEDPRAYIRFRGPVAYAVDDNQRGQTTIKILGLNREDLVNARDEHLKTVISAVEAVDLLPDCPARRKQLALLSFWMSDQGPYRSCLDDAIDALAITE
ncbi:hypothetical protein [Sphingomonas aurantiaca]|uniref:hypothetical protein n=1 Tax=Sphingomonas aurantiaca TaxID=185949 RepID=UPI00335E7FAF